MTRYGRKNRPYYRIAVFDKRTRRDGVSIETLGTYDPLAKEADKKMVIKKDRLAYWLSKGAQPTEPIRLRLKKYKIM
jgi:small subunit ribosomal protein S16